MDTFEDLIESPEKFGAPSFAQFKRNKDFWMGRDDDVLTQVDKGSRLINKGLKKYRFEIEGYRCKSLEELESVILNMGLRLKDMEYKPEYVPLGGGEAEILVRFVSKDERSRREKY